MNKTLRNILAVITGFIGGSLVNGGLVQIGHSVFPLEGIDTNDLDALAEAMPHMEVEHFIFPFLAHAFGTLVGAAIAAAISSNRKMLVAMIVGGIFLIGGIVVNYMLPGPTWFAILDVLLAYIPMAWIGAKIAIGSGKRD
ncbi:hypothetical protein [Halocola ammonii]